MTSYTDIVGIILLNRFTMDMNPHPMYANLDPMKKKNRQMERNHLMRARTE